MRSKLLMIQGTSSGVGKSVIVTALCRILTKKGFKVAPFKSQNMSSYIYKIRDSNKVIARAQAIQSLACRTHPDPNMNPILLQPIGNNESRVYLNGKFFCKMKAQEYYSDFVLKTGFKSALNAFKELQEMHDIIILEGAGSPAEINIQKYDISNMLFARKVNSPVILVSDIERGGCFASILGTMFLLKPTHQNLVKGIIINKFRGDNKILWPAIRKIEYKVKKPVLGIIPKINHNIPEEDSLDSSSSSNKCAQDKKSRQLAFGLKRNTNRNITTGHNIDRFSFDQASAELEIDRFSNLVESSINFRYIMEKIIQ